jgi:hypothetical protein
VREVPLRATQGSFNTTLKFQENRKLSCVMAKWHFAMFTVHRKREVPLRAAPISFGQEISKEFVILKNFGQVLDFALWIMYVAP